MVASKAMAANKADDSKQTSPSGTKSALTKASEGEVKGPAVPDKQMPVPKAPKLTFPITARIAPKQAHQDKRTIIGYRTNNGSHHSTMVNIFLETDVMEKVTGQASMIEEPIWNQFPCRQLVSASEYFAEQLKDVPESTVGKEAQIHKLVLPKSLGKAAVLHVLKWLSSLRLPLSEKYRGKPQVPLEPNMDMFAWAGIYGVIHLFRLRGSLQNQWRLRNTIREYFAGEDIQLKKEHVIHFWKRCSNDEALTKFALNNVIDYIEWLDDQIEDEAEWVKQPNSHAFEEAFAAIPELQKYVRDLEQQKGAARERKAKREQRHEQWIAEKKARKERAIAAARQRKAKEAAERADAVAKPSPGGGVKTITSEQARNIYGDWRRN